MNPDANTPLIGPDGRMSLEFQQLLQQMVDTINAQAAEITALEARVEALEP